MPPATKSVKCRSGLTGFQSRLHTVYEGLEEWTAFAETYGLHIKLGYATPEKAWAANPIVQGSVEPSDYCKVVGRRRYFYTTCPGCGRVVPANIIECVACGHKTDVLTLKGSIG